jgi:hypothetical protein
MLGLGVPRLAPVDPEADAGHDRTVGEDDDHSAGVAELADATDSKSVSSEEECGFDSHLRHSLAG